MPGQLDDEGVERVWSALRRVVRNDPLLSRAAFPDLRPFVSSVNLALTGDDIENELGLTCDALVETGLAPGAAIRAATALAEIFCDEIGTASGALTKSLVATLGTTCSLLTTRLVSAMSELAHRDTVTGLENALAWQERFALLAGRQFAAAMLDLAGLKAVNNDQGQLAGNQYLAGFGSALVSRLPEAATPYRIGGDEFGVLAPGLTADALRSALDGLKEGDGAVRFNFGVAESPTDGVDQPFLEILDKRAKESKQARKVQEQRERGGPDDPLA